MNKDLESLRLMYGEHTIKAIVKAAQRKDSLYSNEIKYNSKPRAALSGQTVTVYNIPVACSGIEVYINDALQDTISCSGAVLTSNSYDINLSGYALDPGTYSIYLTMICGETSAQSNSVSYTIKGLSSVFSDNEWSDIVAASDAGNIPSGWKVGDEKDIELSTGETITMQIIGFDHDDLADGSGKAHLTLFMKNSLTTAYTMNSSNTNTGGWRDSVMRGRMDTFYGYLPEEIQAGIKEVTKKTALQYGDSTLIETTDKLFLLSHVEVMGTNKIDTSTQRSYSGEGSQYDYFKQAPIPDGSSPMNSGDTTGTFISTGSYVNRFGETKSPSSGYYVNYNNTHALGNSSTSAGAWWLRSPSSYASGCFCCVGSVGSVCDYIASGAYGLSFGFCI